MDYTLLSLAEVRAELDDIAREAPATFGGLDRRQLNWRPDETRWSIGQCFEHLLAANRLMLQAADDALDGARPRTVWQRVPVLPWLLGRALIRSQSPEATRTFTAAPQARPAADVAEDVIERFIVQHREAAARVTVLDERQAARTIMTSPFISVVTYSVFDGWRIIVAHDRRHMAQARRVVLSPGFPKP